MPRHDGIQRSLLAIVVLGTLNFLYFNATSFGPVSGIQGLPPSYLPLTAWKTFSDLNSSGNLLEAWMAPELSYADQPELGFTPQGLTTFNSLGEKYLVFSGYGSGAIATTSTNPMDQVRDCRILVTKRSEPDKVINRLVLPLSSCQHTGGLSIVKVCDSPNGLPRFANVNPDGSCVSPRQLRWYLAVSDFGKLFFVPIGKLLSVNSTTTLVENVDYLSTRIDLNLTKADASLTTACWKNILGVASPNANDLFVTVRSGRNCAGINYTDATKTTPTSDKMYLFNISNLLNASGAKIEIGFDIPLDSQGLKMSYSSQNWLLYLSSAKGWLKTLKLENDKFVLVKQDAIPIGSQDFFFDGFDEFWTVSESGTLRYKNFSWPKNPYLFRYRLSR